MSRSGETWRNGLLLVPAMALLLFVYFIPLVRVLVISVVEPTAGLGNYQRLLASEGIQRIFLTTFRIGLITTILAVAIGYLVAYFLIQREGKAFRLAFLAVMIPFWIPLLVRAFAWVVVLRTAGLLNTLLMAMGVIEEPLDLIYNELGVVIGMVHSLVPVAALTLYSQMNGIDRRLMTAAQGLGASAPYAFRRVFLPMSVPGIVSAAILVFISTLGFYIVPAILGGGKTLMLAEYISVMIVGTTNWGLGTAMASVLVIATLLLLAVLSRFVDLRRVFGAA